MSEATKVMPSEIEKELSHLWEALSSKATGEKETRMRASLFNLILFTDKNPRAEYVRGIARKVIEKFPSRVLFITIDRASKEDLCETKISILGASEERSDIVCDFIEFELTSVSAVRVPFLLLPHLIPDLPVYLLWAEDPVLDNPIAYQLERWTTRLIFDSESTSNLPLFATALLKHLEKSKNAIGDLNWARTEGWRTLLLSTFHSEQRLQELQDARVVKLTYNTKKTDFFCHTRIQAIYLQGWLAVQLGWKIYEIDSIPANRPQGSIIFYYEGGSKEPIEVQLIPEERAEMAPGSIAQFEVLTYSGQHFLFGRNKEENHQVTLYIASKDRCELPTHFFFHKGGIGQTLVKEICERATSQHYLQLLKFIAGLEELSLC